MAGFFALLYGTMAGLVAYSIAATLFRGGGASPASRSFLFFSLATFVWNAAYAAMFLSSDAAFVREVYRFSSLGWGANPSLSISYAYLLRCHYSSRPVSRRAVALILVPYPLIVYGVFSGKLLAYDFVRNPFGWGEVVDPSSPWNYAFLALLLVGMVVFAAVGLRLSYHSGSKRAKLQGRFITYPIVAIIVLVVVFHIVLPMLGLMNVPAMVQLLIALWIVALSLVQDKYPVLSLSPLIAADEIVRRMSDMCVLVDSDGRVKETNPAFGALLGSGAGDPIGRLAAEVLPPALTDVLSRAAEDDGGSVSLELALTASDGSSLPCVVSVSSVRDTLGDRVGFVAIIRETREEKRLKMLAETDALTGAYNRRKMEESILSALADPRGRRRRFSVIMMDLDKFKHVNDRFGHEAGDRAIVDFCSIVRSSIRGNDQFARWGGEEFLILSESTDEDEAAVLAERIRARTAAFAFSHGEKLTASFGVASARRGDSLDSLVKRADEALYAAKASGRDRVEIHRG